MRQKNLDQSSSSICSSVGNYEGGDDEKREKLYADFFGLKGAKGADMNSDAQMKMLSEEVQVSYPGDVLQKPEYVFNGPNAKTHGYNLVQNLGDQTAEHPNIYEYEFYATTKCHQLCLIKPFAQNDDEKYTIVGPCNYDLEKFGEDCIIKPFGCFLDGQVLIANNYYQLILLSPVIPSTQKDDEDENEDDNEEEETVEYPELDRYEMPEQVYVMRLWKKKNQMLIRWFANETNVFSLVSNANDKIEFDKQYELDIPGDYPSNITFELIESKDQFAVGCKGCQEVNIFSLEDGTKAHTIKTDFITEIIQCDEDSLYIFSHKDEQKYNKYEIENDYDLTYETTNDQLVISDYCMSTFDGTTIEDTIVTMNGSRVQIFDTIFKKKIAEYQVQGLVRAICLTANKKKLAIYTNEEKLYLVDYPDSIDLNQEQEKKTQEALKNVEKIKDVLDMKIVSSDDDRTNCVYVGTSDGFINVFKAESLREQDSGFTPSYKIKANESGKVSQIAINEDFLFCVLDNNKFFRQKQESDEEDLIMVKQFEKDIVSIDCFITDMSIRVFVNMGDKIIAYDQPGLLETMIMKTFDNFKEEEDEDNDDAFERKIIEKETLEVFDGTVTCQVYMASLNMIIQLIDFNNTSYLNFVSAENINEKLRYKRIELDGKATSLCVSQDEELIGISFKNGKVGIRNAQNILKVDKILVKITIELWKPVVDLVIFDGGSGPCLATISGNILLINNIFQDQLVASEVFESDMKKIVYHNEQSRIMVSDEAGNVHFLSPASMQTQAKMINYKRLVHLIDIENIDKIDMFQFLPNNGLINWNTNIVSVASSIPGKSEILKYFLDHKIPYMENNKKGMKKDDESQEFNKMDILNEFYLNKGLLRSDDALEMRNNYEKKFKDIFCFIQAETDSLDGSENIQGKLKSDGEAIIFESPDELITQDQILKHIDVDAKDQQMISAMTFRQKIFTTFGSKEFVDQLQYYIDASNIMLEETEDKQLVDYFYNKHYTKIAMFNGLYLLQTIICSVYIITHNEHVKFTMFGFSCLFLFIELVQLLNTFHADYEGTPYFKNFWNWLELAGNSMVMRTTFYDDNITWILVMLLSVKGIQSLRIKDSQRVLIQIILSSVIGMIPFLILLGITVFMFAVIQYELLIIKSKTNPKLKPNFMQTLGAQYQILYGENPDAGSMGPFQWCNWVVFSVSTVIVSLNLLIAIISDIYDQVQTAQESTDLRQKLDMVIEVSELYQAFGRQAWFCCFSPVTDCKEVYIHKFINASDAAEGGEGSWSGKVKVLTNKQEAIIAEVAKARLEIKSFQASQDEMRKMVEILAAKE